MKNLMHSGPSIHPVARFPSSLLNNKALYKIFVRASSAKEFIQSNLERLIFILGDFSTYCIHSNGQVIPVDRMYKFKVINPNLVAYNTVDSRGKKTNEIKLL